MQEIKSTTRDAIVDFFLDFCANERKAKLA